MSRSRALQLGCLAALLGLGAILRCLHLDAGLWIDELITLYYSRADGPLEVFERAQAGLQVQDPPYYALVGLTTSWLGESELTLRLPGLVAGILLPLAAYVAVRRSWGQRAAVVALLLTALQPRLLYESHSARPYPVAELCLVLAAFGLSRALASGRVSDRLLTWLPALAAAYTHKLFVCLLPALALAPLLYQKHYTRKRQVLDVSLAFLASLPLLQGLLRAQAGGAESTFWVDPLPLHRVDNLVYPGLHVALGLGAVLVLLALPTRRWFGSARRWLWRAPRSRAVAWDRALIAFFVLLTALHLALIAVSTARGSYLLNERYTTPMVLGVIFLLARWISRWPRALVAAVLTALTFSALRARARPVDWVQYWREAGHYVDAQEPGDAPVLLWTGHAEADLVLRKEPLDPELRGLLECPLALRLDQPNRDLNLVLLPRTWLSFESEAYMDHVVRPRLDGQERFLLVVTPDAIAIFEDWLASRSPGWKRERWAGFSPIAVYVYRR